MKLALINRARYRSTPFAIHAAGCADIARREIPQNDATVTPFEGGIDGALASILDPETVELGYDSSHVEIFPCCRAKVGK